MSPYKKYYESSMKANIVWKNEIEGSFTDSRDGIVYPVVKLGSKVWMGKNFSYLPEVSPPDSKSGIWVYGYQGSDINEARKTESYAKWGCLYDWNKANAAELFPQGWKLPTCEDFNILISYFGNTPEAAYKAITSPKEDKFKFSWAGMKGVDRKFSGVKAPGLFAAYWSCEEKHSGAGWNLFCNDFAKQLSLNYNKKSLGVSIRLILI
jgi:uncharacterized protein (TIGR02145 family)